MEDDVEKFLLEQLSKAVVGVEESLKSSSISVQCGELKDLIKKMIDDTDAAVDHVILRENLYYLNNIVAEWRLVLEKHNLYSLAAQIDLNGPLNNRLQKIRKDLEALAASKDETSKHKRKVDDHEVAQEDGASRDKEKLDIGKSRGLSNPYHVDLSKIWGIDDKSKAMERLLVRKETRNKEFQAIGIVGMTGVGKTTFCQVAFNNEEVKKHFLPRIWVEMSEQPVRDEEYKKEVVKSFLRSLGFEDKVITEIGESGGGLRLLLLALRKQLQGKRYLVVLDDIWHLDERFKKFCSSLAEDIEGDKFEPSLSYGLPKGSGGCVIVTSRSESWAVSMVGKKMLQRMTALEDKTSMWEIFLNAIYDQRYSLLDKEEQDVMDEGMKKLQDEIVKRCAGLPLMAKMLGENMVTKFLEGKGKGEGKGEGDPKPA